jgi:hypothetical protein
MILNQTNFLINMDINMDMDMDMDMDINKFNTSKKPSLTNNKRGFFVFID